MHDQERVDDTTDVIDVEAAAFSKRDALAFYLDIRDYCEYRVARLREELGEL